MENNLLEEIHSFIEWHLADTGFYVYYYIGDLKVKIIKS